MRLPEVETRWYEHAQKVARTPDETLREVSRMPRAARCSFRKIARLHPVIGSLIDELRCPLRLAKAIAHAPTAEQWRRAEQYLAALVERRALRSTEGRARFEREMLTQARERLGPPPAHAENLPKPPERVASIR